MITDKCVICEKVLPDGIVGRNNPWPIKDEGECCDTCNSIFVVSQRLIMIWTKEQRNDSKC